MTHHLVHTVQGVAVIPPAHIDKEDPDIGLHVHIDRRFHHVDGGAVLRVSPCTKPIMTWMEQINPNPHPFRIEEIEALEIWHQSCRIGRDGRCPHQGLPVWSCGISGELDVRPER